MPLLADTRQLLPAHDKCQRHGTCTSPSKSAAPASVALMSKSTTTRGDAKYAPASTGESEALHSAFAAQSRCPFQTSMQTATTTAVQAGTATQLTIGCPSQVRTSMTHAERNGKIKDLVIAATKAESKPDTKGYWIADRRGYWLPNGEHSVTDLPMAVESAHGFPSECRIHVVLLSALEAAM